ncbi:hypothetical protein bcgnr5372_28240 [Bacillus luti]
MLKVFRVKANNISYGEDKSIVIVAETKQRALEIANSSHNWEEYGRKDKNGRQKDFDENKMFWDFKEWQNPLVAIEIDLSVERVIEVSTVGD